MSYQVIWHPRGATKRFYGRVGGADILASVIEVESDRRFDGLRYVINDFLAAESFDPGGLDIEEVAAIDKAAAASNPNILIAVVAERPEIVALASAYAGSALNAYRTEIFSSLAAAEAWLGQALSSGLGQGLRLATARATGNWPEDG